MQIANSKWMNAVSLTIEKKNLTGVQMYAQELQLKELRSSSIIIK